MATKAISVDLEAYPHVETVLFWLAVLTSGGILVAAVDLARGALTVQWLRRVAPAEAGLPAVSVVVAARNEERQVEAGLCSLLAQDHRPLEVIVVDDRSEDRTGEIVERLATGEPRLRPIRVDELPGGWLGKNHALWRGARVATGELILFTDADVVMHPTAVRRAATWLQERELDHLAVGPQIIAPGVMVEAFVVVFTLVFSLFTRPWKARDPHSSRAVGIGAFNLVRAEAYRRAGTHRAIAMRPDDDLKLGELIKGAGFRQDVVVGTDLVRVEWYPSIRAVVEGLMKNSFAAVDYSVPAVLAGVLGLLFFGLWPFVGLAVAWALPQATAGPAGAGGAAGLAGTAGAAGPGITWWLHVASVGLILAAHAAAALQSRLNPATAPLFPLVLLLFVYIQLRAMVLTLARGGIEWRGTRYPLDELRKG